MIVDAHHHLWDPARADYPWLTEELAPIRRAFTLDDLAPALAARGVERTMVVQTRASVDETTELLAVADESDVVAGVVGWVALTGDVATAIDELRAAPGGDRLVGIRHQVHDEDDARWVARDDVVRGIAAVGAAGLAYDLLVRTRELPAALETVRAVPGTTFVIDHLAKPPLAGGDLDAWRDALAPLADEENVVCKVSGLVTEADWSAWDVGTLEPAVRFARERFGDDRLLWGSDWPVCLLAASYGQVFDAYVAALGPLDAAARTAILGGNAARVYGLDD